MKKEQISEVMEHIHPAYIEEATHYSSKKTPIQFSSWRKWVLSAACILLITVVVLPFLNGLFKQSSADDYLEPTVMITYENAYYEIIQDSKICEKLGINPDLSQEDAGEHIAYLQKEYPSAEYSDYLPSETETNIQLLEYAPAPYKAVYIFKEGEQYSYAVFCNYLVETDECLPIQDAFDVYGIKNASDIVSITPVKGNSAWKKSGKSITDPDIISEFFHALSQVSAACFSDYHDAVFADEIAALQGTGEDISQEAYNKLANDKKNIVLETKEGLRFKIGYYPSYGWLHVSQTMSYYPITPELLALLP